ncbi:hypothetical protein SAMN05192533_102319 [Mesobacillus persicus]|uniref:Uncharacterized protein n=1 Tax=Mesobacillus persicus TaxID=930146 RepID=A0A1H7XS79_9BACI|nr:hypothetical protein [Mesobacillus persicus]SEM36008.1 hypothetical protein SAMN05192533_102319 [Mesobacillus persicus]
MSDINLESEQRSLLRKKKLHNEKSLKLVEFYKNDPEFQQMLETLKTEWREEGLNEFEIKFYVEDAIHTKAITEAQLSGPAKEAYSAELEKKGKV